MMILRGLYRVGLTEAGTPIFGATRRGLATLTVLLTVAIALSVLGTLALSNSVGNRHKVEALVAYNHHATVTGEPVSACLLDTFEAIKPLLLKLPNVELPLAAYIRLERNRFPGVDCPVGEP